MGQLWKAALVSLKIDMLERQKAPTYSKYRGKGDLLVVGSICHGEIPREPRDDVRRGFGVDGWLGSLVRY